MALSKWPLKGWIFCTQGAKNETPPETLKLKVREVSQIGFWNISWQPTSVPSFSQIGWPQLLAPGTLSQTMTLNTFVTKILFCSLQYIFVLQSLIRFCFVKTFLCLSLVFEIVAKFVRSRWLDISLVDFYAVIYGPRRILEIFDPSTPVVWGKGERCWVIWKDKHPANDISVLHAFILFGQNDYS